MNRPTPPTRRPRRGRPAGFTLTEVLIALGVFALGFVAVASVFPVAILMQKATVNEVEGRTFARNLKATLGALGLEVNGTTERWSNLEVSTDPLAPKNDPDRVKTLPDTALARLNIADFSYGAADALDFRRQFAIPLIVDLDTGASVTPAPNDTDRQDWQLHVFIVARNGDRAGRYPKDATDTNDNWAEVPGFEQQGRPGGTRLPIDALRYDDIPGVFKQPVTRSGLKELRFTNDDGAGRLLVRIGDQVVDNLGFTHRVTEAFNDRIAINGIASPAVQHVWFAHPGQTGRSSFVRLVTLGVDYPKDSGGAVIAGQENVLILKDLNP